MATTATVGCPPRRAWPQDGMAQDVVATMPPCATRRPRRARPQP
jgi:hypothetical protein